MAWNRGLHLWNFLAVSSLGILRCSTIGFGPSTQDRKSNEMIIESNGLEFASVSLKGKSSKYKWKQYNQDSYFYRIGNNIDLLGVCDGHGPKGHSVSHHIAQQISNYVEKTEIETLSNNIDPNTWLNDILNYTANEIDQRTEIETKRTNIGDSRAIICYRHPNSEWKLSTKQLNVEHSPNVQNERHRIYNNGGYIDNRGYVSHSNTPYGINMTRSLGDDDIHYNNIVSSDPDIVQYEISSHDICIVHATDGITDMMDNNEVATIIHHNLPNLEKAAIDIVNECEMRWRQYAGRVDDITITIFALKSNLLS
eukprot:261573_1